MASIPVRTCYCRRKLIGNYLKGFGWQLLELVTIKNPIINADQIRWIKAKKCKQKFTLPYRI